jgi:hypothetical protein
LAELYDEINKLVESRLKIVNARGESVDITDWVSQLTESLADMIVFGTPPELQQRMMLFALERLEQFVSENQKMLAEEEQGPTGLH